MARKPIPKYRRQKRPEGNDTAFAEVDGHRVYLGPYDSQESRERYARLLAEVESRAGSLPSRSSTLTVVEVLAAYWRHVESYYVKDGRPTGEVESVPQAVRTGYSPTHIGRSFRNPELASSRRRLATRRAG